MPTLSRRVLRMGHKLLTLVRSCRAIGNPQRFAVQTFSASYTHRLSTSIRSIYLLTRAQQERLNTARARSLHNRSPPASPECRRTDFVLASDPCLPTGGRSPVGAARSFHWITRKMLQCSPVMARTL